MIQLRRGEFTNFRLLRDVKIEFATDCAQPLTVICANGGTGKTTLLNALGWALFGDEALPGNRSSFRLHPIDWDPAVDGPNVPVKVLIEFAALDEETDTEVIFELERSTTERLVGDVDFEVAPSTLVLLRHGRGGVETVENATATVASLLPPSLKDIFFIDGDRALAFIEATDEQRVKRDRVAKAVRALLGLDLLEDAERHVDKARKEAVSAIRKLGAGTDIERLAGREQGIEARTEVMKETAAKDMLAVIRGAIGVLQGETIDEVSEQMNAIFLKMIVADEEAGSVVKRVTLTRTHDFIVEGPGGRRIDPDTSLNGASRRALTLAFILSVVKISGVQAPILMDSPLGMMGVEMRQVVLKCAAVNSTQLVMFLTGSEVLGVEDLLDEFAGRVYTFSNAADYPTKLLNDPGTSRTETLVCDCNHRQSCDLCRRRTNIVQTISEPEPA